MSGIYESYKSLVVKGLKKLEDIPEAVRSKVEEMLNEES